LDLVFCSPQGNYLKPNNVSSKACQIARRVGLGRGVSMHTLRHSHASQLLSSGVSLPTVSKRLGRTDVHTTASIYSHALPKDDLKAAETWDAKFQETERMVANGCTSVIKQ
jgi:site-specific recombinase XerD